MKKLRISMIIIMFMAVISCQEKITSEPNKANAINIEQNTASCLQKMEEHLNAVSNRDLETLKSTLSPTGKMLLLLPKTETIVGVDAFMKYHEEWFSAPDWTFTSSIVDSEVGQDMAFVIVESMYREPERDGKPYYNRMSISYDLKKIEGTWYVVKDHATSIEKSTDE